MRDIAAEANVSVSTVSLALKNSARISGETKDSVMRIAEKLEYRPDPRVTELMEHLRMERSKRQASRIAILIPELDADELKEYHPLHSNITGMHEQAGLAGFDLEVIYLKTLNTKLSRIRGILMARGIKGLVLAPFKSGVGHIDMNYDGFSVATAGYSITKPDFNRACPNYLQMMDELLEHMCSLGYRRIGFIMTYHKGGTGHKLFASSFLYYQSEIDEKDRIPILHRSEISDNGIRQWMEKFQPQVVISAGQIYHKIRKLGYRIPQVIGFASLDLSEPPYDAAGMHHRHRQVGRETIKLVLTSLNFNLTGVPEHPKIVLVDSHRKEGDSLKKVGPPIPINLRKTIA
jgi:LacI family transcriptional regulator